MKKCWFVVAVQILASSAPIGYCCHRPITNTCESENTAASSETHEGQQLLKHSAYSQHEFSWSFRPDYSQSFISERSVSWRTEMTTVPSLANSFRCHGNPFPAALIDVFTTERRDTEKNSDYVGAKQRRKMWFSEEQLMLKSFIHLK